MQITKHQIETAIANKEPIKREMLERAKELAQKDGRTESIAFYSAVKAVYEGQAEQDPASVSQISDEELLNLVAEKARQSGRIEDRMAYSELKQRIAHDQEQELAASE